MFGIRLDLIHFRLPDPFECNKSGYGLIKNQPKIIEKISYDKDLIFYRK